MPHSACLLTFSAVLLLATPATWAQAAPSSATATAPAQSTPQAAPATTSAPTAERPAPSIASHPEWPKARPADVQSVDAILAALYDVISGPVGQQRDRDRFLSLFVPDARLMPVHHAKQGDGADVVVLSPQQFYAIAEPAFEKGFFERGIHDTRESFGDMVHIFSTYESRRAKDDANPFARGINSIQLLKDGKRYWVITILWDEEGPGLTLPAKYLP